MIGWQLTLDSKINKNAAYAAFLNKISVFLKFLMAFLLFFYEPEFPAIKSKKKGRTIATKSEIIENAIINPDVIRIPFLLDFTEKHEQTRDAIDNSIPGIARTKPMPVNI